MKLTWTKARDATEKGTFLAMVQTEEQKHFVKFEFGKPQEVDDEIAYLILGDARFKGLFTQEGVVPKAKSFVGKPYANKSAAAESMKGE